MYRVNLGQGAATKQVVNVLEGSEIEIVVESGIVSIIEHGGDQLAVGIPVRVRGMTTLETHAQKAPIVDAVVLIFHIYSPGPPQATPHLES